MLPARLAPAILAVAFSLAQMSVEATGQANDEQRPAPSIPMHDLPPQSCNVTLPSEGNPVPSVTAASVRLGADRTVGGYGTGNLWTFLPTNGIWRGRAQQNPDEFAYDNKMPWFRFYPGFSEKDQALTITGKRLDGPAPSFTEIFEGMSLAREGENAMIMGGISIPVFGCWEITGHYQNDALSFIVWVTPLAEQASDSAETSPTTPPEPWEQKAAPRRVHVNGEVEERSLVYRLTPELPHEAQVTNISGTVVLHAVIGTDGRAHDLHYVSGPSLLVQAAIDAVTWWQYRISELNTEIDTTIPVVFPSQDN